MNYLEYKGYKGTVEYSSEDDCFFGKVVGLGKDLIAYEGKTMAELRADFEAGIDSYLQGFRTNSPESCKLFSKKSEQ